MNPHEGDVCRALLLGVPTRAVAARFHYSQSTVWRIAHRAGLRYSATVPDGRWVQQEGTGCPLGFVRWTKHKKGSRVTVNEGEVCRALLAGVPTRTVAYRFGCSAATIWRIARRDGLAYAYGRWVRSSSSERS